MLPPSSRLPACWITGLLLTGLLALGNSLQAQYAVPAAPSGAVVVQTAEGAPQIIKMEGGKPVIVKPDQPDAKPEAKKDGEAKEEKPGEKGEKKEEKPAIVKRPTTPPAPPDPSELDIRPDASGKVRFNFRGQPWPDVLDWLAEVSGMSLDWQELPGDFLNLVTQQTYTVDEARDLINRHLLARGFTLLVVGEVLTVAKTENINTALVPRVEPDALAKHMPHEYVKVSFPLDSMTADVAVDELKPMLSSNAKLTPLSATNRLEAVDAVANLREVQAVLTREQSPTTQERLVREFVLQYARATDVQQQLLGLLGIESKSRGPAMPMSPQQMEMMQQQQQAMMAQMQQQQQQQRGGQPPGASRPKKEQDVNLVVNTRRNSVLATAPPDKMAIIAKAVEVIDVPVGRDQSLLLNAGRMQVYRLAAIDPETLIRALQDSGDLDPTTSLVVDKKNRAIIAYAPLADHLTIRTLVEKLDGSSRKFEVIRLRRLAADYVAGTIGFMMGQDQEKKEERPRYWGYYDDYRSRSSEDQSQDKFRVDADVEGNRLLLWANDIELEEVHNLLVKLGEIPATGPGQDRVRVLDVDVSEDAAVFLEQIRRAWPSLAPKNELILPPAETLPKKKETPEKSPPTPTPKPSRPPAEARSQPHNVEDLIRFAQLTKDQPDSAAETPDASPQSDATPESPPPNAKESPPQETSTPKTDAPNSESRTPNPEPRSLNSEPRTPNPEPRTLNPEPRTLNPEPRTLNPELRTLNPEPRSLNPEPRSPASGTPDPQEPRPPVQITVGPDGKLVISSQDPAALDLLEELISQLTPEPKDYKIFPLKYASAFWTRLNLEDFFKEEEKEKDGNRRYYFYDYAPPAEKEKSYRLSKRRPLKFIDDVDTNTILVVGANQEQLRTIEELIRLWDTPPPTDSESARVSAVFQVRYSKAEFIAEAVKDVYRDLLSSNDKALQQNRDDKRAAPQTTYIFGESGSSEPDRRTQVSFKGKLSIGVDEVSNTLLVSTEGQNLLENVSKMIEALDEAAKPVSDVKVVTLPGNVNAERVREVLSEVLGKGAVVSSGQGASPSPPPGMPPGPGGAPAPNGRR